MFAVILEVSKNPLQGIPMADNTTIARVSAIQGQAFAKDKNGALRVLRVGDQIFEAFTVGATLRLAFFIVLLGSAPLIVVAAKKIGEIEYVADGAWGVYLA